MVFYCRGRFPEIIVVFLICFVGLGLIMTSEVERDDANLTLIAFCVSLLFVSTADVIIETCIIIAREDDHKTAALKWRVISCIGYAICFVLLVGSVVAAIVTHDPAESGIINWRNTNGMATMTAAIAATSFWWQIWAMLTELFSS